MTWILALATFGVLTTIAVACRRAHVEAEASVRDWLQTADEPCLPVAAAPSPPALFVVPGEGGAEPRAGFPEEETTDSRGRLRLVGA